MRALVVAEFYPRAHDPVLGIWAHRQALAAREDAIDEARHFLANREYVTSDQARRTQATHRRLHA